jgi:hypothetical protein
MNPLLDFSGLPRFDAVQPEHVAPAIRQLLDENRALIDRPGRAGNRGDLGCLRAAHARRRRAPVARLGHRRPPAFGE